MKYIRIYLQILFTMNIPIYPTLYITQSSNKIYEWSIKITPIKSGGYTVITSHGQTDGKQILHSTDILEGKANRSALEQAVLEANRKWENKKTKDLYSEHGSSNPITVRPMLANKFSFDLYKKGGRSFKIEFPAFVQRKYDGIRCISYLKNGEVILESRKGIGFENFITLKSQLKTILSKCPSHFYFDGELYTDKIPFETVSGLIRLTEKKALPEEKAEIEKIEYHIYDFYDATAPDMICKDRFQLLYRILDANHQNNSCFLCKPVTTYVVNGLDEIQIKHDEFVQEGYEGIMIRDMNGPYEINKRSRYLQKYKVFMEEEFMIVGFHEGVGDELGAIVWDCKTKDGKLFSTRPKGTVDSRKQLFNDGNKYVGKMLTVIFQEYSADGIPRFPVGKAIREFY
jgi:ATP-dependent DNA ligase